MGSIVMQPRYGVLDLGWQYADRRHTRKDNPSKKPKFGMGVARRYITMKLDEICDMGPAIRSVFSADGYLFSWATCPALPDAIKALEAWGFPYVTTAMVWVKSNKNDGEVFAGGGHYTFPNVELLLLGRNRKHRLWHTNTGYKPKQALFLPHPRTPDGAIDQSRKPEEFQDCLERWLGPQTQNCQPPVEICARRKRRGWTCLGNEVTGRRLEQDLPSLAALHQTLDLRKAERAGLQMYV